MYMYLVNKSISPRLSLLPLRTNTLPGPSASEVTNLWRCTNLFITIIIIGRLWIGLAKKGINQIIRRVLVL